MTTCPADHSSRPNAMNLRGPMVGPSDRDPSDKLEPGLGHEAATTAYTYHDVLSFPHPTAVSKVVHDCDPRHISPREEPLPNFRKFYFPIHLLFYTHPWSHLAYDVLFLGPTESPARPLPFFTHPQCLGLTHTPLFPPDPKFKVLTPSSSSFISMSSCLAFLVSTSP